MDNKNNINTIIVPDQYKFVIDRIFLEYNRRVSNLAFMIYKHDNDVDFLESDLVSELEESAIDALFNYINLVEGLRSIFKFPEGAVIRKDERKDYYFIRW